MQGYGLKMNLNKEVILSIINDKYGPLVSKQVSNNGCIPVTKEFYSKYETNNRDIFYFNKKLRTILIHNQGLKTFEDWLVENLKKATA